ncbi:uncharacterized protein [Asterias amurensis]|uniref:uncharacterized protein n=1 Tax=Asterias amurensis TaxID=7602 RepID=UPI003AB3128E
MIPRIVRRRKAWLFCIVAIGTVCFLFQFLGIHFLSSNDRKIEQSWYKNNKPKAHIKPAIIGVRPKEASLYSPDSDGNFWCLDLTTKIPFYKVNDEYCDCVGDGSDEPGTDACPNGRFYCFQDQKFIPSGRVNDGICDCCDGSEEWNQSASIRKVKDLPHSNQVKVAPCENACKGSVKFVAEQEKMRQIGARLKQQYIIAGKNHKGEIYGSNGEYYKLSKNCLTRYINYAHYTVCPFEKIIQEQNGHSFTIGRSPSWDKDAQDDQVDILLMEDGDRKGCPAGTRRKTYIYFACGLTDDIISVKETDQCVYSVRCSTPAAC